MLVFAGNGQSSARLRGGGFEARGRSGVLQSISAGVAVRRWRARMPNASLGERRDVWADARQDIEGFLEGRHLLVDKRTPGAQG